VFRAVGIRVGRTRGSDQPCTKSFGGRWNRRRERSYDNECNKFLEYSRSVEFGGFAPAH
jgi:hypothetical protein